MLNFIQVDMQSGGILKTQNLLQPLDGEETRESIVDLNAKPPAAAGSLVEHVLPGGIGTYSISHISYFNPRVPKPEENIVSDNSNSSSYTGGGFTLWDESSVRKATATAPTTAANHNFGDLNLLRESLKMGHWGLDRPSQSSSNHRSSVSPLSSSRALVQKSQSFMEMIKSAKGPHSIEQEIEEDFSLKKENTSSLKGELHVNVGGNNGDQKPITPRSKHSATEQRRRCKINDRFQMLRELIPHSDQKRDKASFLLEVIEYIQYLQEKVNRYEGSYPGWNSEPPKLNPWINSQGVSESFVDQSRVVNGITSPVLMFGAKLDEKATAVSLNVPHHPPTPEESSMTNAINVKTADQQPGISNNAGSIIPPLQHDIHAPVASNCAKTQPPMGVPSEGRDASFPQLQLWQSGTSASEQYVPADKLKEQELALEGGTINISSIYSQGLLSTLTRALQSSGVDLSQASISVQVDIGKRANNRQKSQEAAGKGAEGPSGNQSLLHARVDNTSSESDHAVKRLKTG